MDVVGKGDQILTEAVVVLQRDLGDGVALAAGEIKDLELQKQYELQPAFRDANGKMVKPIYYRADFVYTDVKTGETIIEDVKCKATKTPQYNIKKKMMAYRGLMIREIE